ncbi:hypothetical protein OESDEN_21292, partial [Oesophagostomum dentatum]
LGYFTIFSNIEFFPTFAIFQEGSLSNARKTIQLNTDSQPVAESKKNKKKIVVTSVENRKGIVELTTPKDGESTAKPTDVPSSTVTTSAKLQIRGKEAADREIIRVPTARTMHEFQFDEEPIRVEKTEGTAGLVKRGPVGVKYHPKRSKRDVEKKEETAPPVQTPAKELEKEKMKELSEKIQHNLSEGRKSPSIDKSVTVP